MRIGVEGRTLQGKRYGVARYLSNLLRNLVEVSDDEFVVYLSEPIEPLSFDSDAIEQRIFRAPSITWRHLRLPLEMKRDRVDLHFSPSYFVPLLRLCPAVVVVHDLTFKVHPEWFAKDRRMRFDDFFWREVRRADRIVTESEHSKSDIVRVLGVEPSRVSVIPEAADSRFGPLRDEARAREVRDRLGLGDSFVFTAGAIHTRRNLERLIEALGMSSRDAGVDSKLLIVGTPAPFSPPVDIEGTASAWGLSERVVHVDYVSEDDLLSLYNACAAFVYPSLYEGFGLPVIEAMACGAPVACSNVTSLPEVGGDAVLYFDPLNTEEISEAVTSVLTDEALRKRLSAAGIERAGTFSWRRAAEETDAVFKEVVG